MTVTIRGRAVMAGTARGRLLATVEPLSFWGGYDPTTGEVIDRRHPLSGRLAAGRVLAVPSTRGSSTTTAVLLEAIRAGTAPAAVVTRGVDSFVTLAAVVAEEMYGRCPAVIALTPDDFATLDGEPWVTVGADGLLVLGDGPVGTGAEERRS